MFRIVLFFVRCVESISGSKISDSNLRLYDRESDTENKIFKNLRKDLSLLICDPKNPIHVCFEVSETIFLFLSFAWFNLHKNFEI